MIEIKNVSKIYKTGDEQVVALKNISLNIEDGEFIALVGPSGSGKSTLLHLIGGLDKVTHGEIIVDGDELKKMKDKDLSGYRSSEIGFIFQDFHLLPHLNLLENVEIPLLFTPKRLKESTMLKKAKELLGMVDLENRMDHKPAQISGGQKQRAAIARAIMNKPKILLADEPTGNLDSMTAKNIITLLKRLHLKEKMTVIVVTHDYDIAKYAERIVEIKDGRLNEQNKTQANRYAG